VLLAYWLKGKISTWLGPNAVILYYNVSTDLKQFQNFINQKLYKQPGGFCT